ncbi:octopamine receptor beta-2R-like [Amphiura filiformis]|uniref:octopamine receptor beta-2R-like n=1 Tax=Amphiura filiformis TaxID=82378 RepID=UPI003B226BC7
MDLASNLHILYVVAGSIMAIVTLICNMATVVAFFKVSFLRQKPSNLLILNLSCADLGVGLILVCNFPQVFVKPGVYGKYGCQLFNFLANLFVSSGMVTTVAISMDRFLLLSGDYPKYLRIQSKKRIMCIIGGIWLYGILLGTSEVLLWDMLMPPGLHDYFDFSRDCRSPPKHNLVYALVLFVLGVFGPLLAIESFSIAFLVQLIRKFRKPMVHPSSDIMSSQNANLNSSRSAAGPIGSSSVPMAQGAAIPMAEADPNKRYKKAAILLGAIVLVVNICTLPYVLYALITIFCSQCNNVHLRDVLTYLIYLNSCINPFLYAATMIRVRKFYKRVLFNSQ